MNDADYARALSTRLHELLGVENCEHACVHVVFGEWTALGIANVLARHRSVNK